MHAIMVTTCQIDLLIANAGITEGTAGQTEFSAVSHQPPALPHSACEYSHRHTPPSNR